MHRGLYSMTDIRLEEMPFPFEGKTYLLRCNMNVLADVQDSYGGTITDALQGGKPSRSVMEFLSAMMNDYADEQGWPERFTTRTLGRKLGPNQVPTAEIMGLVLRAVIPPSDAEEEETPPTSEESPDQSGN